MRRLALSIGIAASLAASVALAAHGGNAAPKPGLREALAKTAHASSLRYAFKLTISNEGMPLALHVRGQADAKTISVHLATAGLSGAEMVDGPYLYEEAPGGLVADGQFRWLRTSIARLPADSQALVVLHALTAEPLLRLVGKARMHASPTAGDYSGTVAYDDPVVRDGLTPLTGGMEFRDLRLAVHVARDGRIHSMQLLGKTADGSSTLRLSARLFAFGKPVHVSPPKPGTFMDDQLLGLSE
jgi:hypothetical protein